MCASPTKLLLDSEDPPETEHGDILRLIHPWPGCACLKITVQASHDSLEHEAPCEDRAASGTAHASPSHEKKSGENMWPAVILRDLCHVQSVRHVAMFCKPTSAVRLLARASMLSFVHGTRAVRRWTGTAGPARRSRVIASSAAAVSEDSKHQRRETSSAGNRGRMMTQ